MATINLTSSTPDKNNLQQIVPAFPDNAFTITPSDADDFSAPVTVYAGGAGTVTVVPWAKRAAGTTQQFTVVAGGTVPCRVAAVKSAGTAATLLVGVY